MDTQAPASFTLNLPVDGVTVNKPYPYFSWNASSDGNSGLAKLQLYIDGSLQRDNIINWTAAVPSTALANGSHTWFVRAWDNAGNYRDSATRALTINAGTGKIAFDSDRDHKFEIYVMNTDGSSQTNLTNSSDADYGP
ncbi:MAG: Ig-like domain-containing protein, partial [Nitrospirota bacterium]